MQILRMRSVFVPGGVPKHTYVERAEGALRKVIASAKDNLCKLVTVTGETKSGKSVLVNTIFPRKECVWIDGGSVGTEESFWQQVVELTDGFTDLQESAEKGTTTGISGEAKGTASVPFLVKGEASVQPSFESNRSSGMTRSRAVSPKSAAIDGLTRSSKPLIVDDFHYLDREIQANIVRAIKGLVFGGHPVIFLAIPHRKYDAIRVEREMTGRVEQVTVPPWTLDELTRISDIGFPLLNTSVDASIRKHFLEQSIGSPHLMQEFCRQLCADNGVEETETEHRFLKCNDLSMLFGTVAEDTSKTVFDKLAKGPNQRTDRNQRKFKDGSTADIYVAVLRALASLKPGMVSLTYEDIRSALRELMVDTPQAHEVTRVLDYMCKIQANDAASAPVIDWEKEERILHVTDPFFAFFLRWGVGSDYSRNSRAIDPK